MGFTERRQFEHAFNREIWLDEAWHLVHYHTNQGKTLGGVLVDGTWHRLLFTNGCWAIEPSGASQSEVIPESRVNQLECHASMP